MSCSFQNRNFVCEQNPTGSKDRDMEQDDGFGFWIWGVTEVKEVAVGSETTNDVGAWGSIAGEVLTRIFHSLLGA